MPDNTDKNYFADIEKSYMIYSTPADEPSSGNNCSSTGSNGSNGSGRDRRFAVGDLIMNRYRVISELGQGGMGVVYECLDETGGVKVALKALPPELSHNTIEMEDIKENFQLVEKLVHQNIAVCKNLERDPDNGNYYLIMECCAGEDLRRYIKRKRKAGDLTLEAVQPIIMQVASALDYAHKQKIIHRDIKPGNILINKDGEIKVLDFGLAAQIHTSMNRVSAANQGTSGTAPYMAPEQWCGRRQTAATDQYALAVMTYEMLAGYLPFDCSDKEVLQQAVLNQQPEPIGNIPAGTQKALDRAMSKDPEKRFASCSDFADALKGQKIKLKVNQQVQTKTETPTAPTPRKRGCLPLIIILLVIGVLGYLLKPSTQPDSTVKPAQPAQPVQPADRTSQIPPELDKEKTDLKLKILELEARFAKLDMDCGSAFQNKYAEFRRNVQAAGLAAHPSNSIQYYKQAQQTAEWLLQNAPQGKEAKLLLAEVNTFLQSADRPTMLEFAAPTFKLAQTDFNNANSNYQAGNFSAALEFGVKARTGFTAAASAAADNKVKKLLQNARAMQDKDYHAMQKYAEEVLAIQSGNQEAQELLQLAKKKLLPALAITATLDNKKVAAWALTDDNKVVNFSEAPFMLTENQMYHLLVWAKSGDRIFARDISGNAAGQGIMQMNVQLQEIAISNAETMKICEAALQGSAQAQHQLGECYYNGAGITRNTAEALNWYQRAAGQGYTESLYALAQHFYNNRNKDGNLPTAIKYLRMAADKAHAEAQYKLGYCYSQGIGVQPDPGKAVKYFQQAAAQGHAEAQYYLGLFYFSGIGVEKNVQKAIKYFQQAAPNTPVAMSHLGYLYKMGKGVEKNTAEADRCFRLALQNGLREKAERGLADAQFYLGYLYDTGSGIAANAREAIKWYSKAAAQGHTSAQHNLGLKYLRNPEVKNEREAVKYFRMVADKDFATAQYILAKCYYEGKGVEQNYTEAFKYYSKAAAKDLAAAQYMLGECYYFGRGVEQNFYEAFKYYSLVAAENYAETQYALGRCYYFGKGVAKDYYQAFQYFNKAAGKQHIRAQYYLGECYFKGRGVSQNKQTGIKWYQKSAAQKDPLAQCALAWLYKIGDGVKKNTAESDRYFRLAHQNGLRREAEQGDITAQYYLGYCYESGSGVPQDYQEGFNWTRKAAEQGLAGAQSNLALYYLNGTGVQQDSAEGVKWFRKAAEQGHADAQNNLGYCYLNGLGVKRNHSEAFSYFRKAAETGDAYAHPYTLFNMGLCYEKGYGITRNVNEAIKYYRQAAEEGHDGAKKALQRLQRYRR